MRVPSGSRKGWREHVQTGGQMYYPRDRWWIKVDGKWKKSKPIYRTDLPPLTKEQYEKRQEVKRTKRSGNRKPVAIVG